MSMNIGKFDRAVRLLLVAAICGLYFTKIVTGIFGVILLALAGVLLITSLFRFCPLYLPFGIRTVGRKAC